MHEGRFIDMNKINLITIGVAAFIMALYAVFVFYLRTNLIISILLGTITSFVIPWAIIAFLTSQNKKKFLEEFPIALDIMRRALRAGHSIDRAINMVIEQVIGPVGQAFKRI